jgi:hypothetical protein
MANNTRLFNTDRDELRDMYFQAFYKFQRNEALDSLEKQIVTLIQSHPELHFYFEDPEKYRHYIFSPEKSELNPFLHLGLHLSLHEQVMSNRPKGITAIYRDLVINFSDSHHAEHHMMEILSDQLWQLTQKQKFFDEKDYIKRLKKLLKRGCHHNHH